jgi:hypothetical protein
VNFQKKTFIYLPKWTLIVQNELSIVQNELLIVQNELLIVQNELLIVQSKTFFYIANLNGTLYLKVLQMYPKLW